MQRRAAAMYFAFFVLIAIGAYGMIATTSAPHVSFDAQAYSQGDSVTLNDREYTVSEVKKEKSEGGGHGGGGGATLVGTLTWVNDSARYTETLSNDSTVEPTKIHWKGIEGRDTVKFENATNVTYNGSQYRATVDGSTLTLTSVANASRNATFEAGDTVTYQDEEATVTKVTNTSARLVWGDPYRVVVSTENDTTSVALVQDRNTTELLQDDPAVYNETSTIEGVEYVTFKANDTNRRLSEYVDDPERKPMENGTQFRYDGNQVTVVNANSGGVTVAWTAPKENEVPLSEGGQFDANGEAYFAHFPNKNEVQLLSVAEHMDSYEQQNERIDAFHERENGLWGVVELSGLAAIILLMTAYLPVRG